MTHKEKMELLKFVEKTGFPNDSFLIGVAIHPNSNKKKVVNILTF